MVKQMVVYLYAGIALSKENKQIDTCNNPEEYLENRA